MTQLADFVALCQALASTAGRLDKLQLVSDFLRRLEPDEARDVASYLTGRPFPASDPRVLSARWLPATPPADHAVLTLRDVADAFSAVAGLRGPGSRQAREARLLELAARATAAEQAVLGRIIGGEMRTGVSDGLVLEAIGRAAGADLATTRRAGLFLGDVSAVASVAQAGGAAALAAATPRLFVPLAPMLAELATDYDVILAAHGGRSALEYK